MSTISKIYKSRQYYLSVPVRNFGVLRFVNHRLLISESNTELIELIETELIPKNPELGIYIDPEDKAVDTSTLNPRVFGEAEYDAYLQNKQNVNLGIMPSDNTGSNIGVSSAAELQGKSGAQDSARFAAQDILRAKLAKK